MLFLHFMKKLIFILAACVGIAPFFTSCDKADDEASALKITATVTDGASYNALVDEVKALVLNDDETADVLASCTYANGGFSLTLPGTVDEQYLSKIDMDEPEEIKISDTEVMGCGVDFYAYKSGVEAGALELSYTDGLTTYASAGYLYVTGKTTISGTYAETEEMLGVPVSVKTTYNLSLKKGWNVVYVNSVITATDTDISMTIDITDTEITTLKWCFSEDEESYLSRDLKSAAFKALNSKIFVK